MKIDIQWPMPWQENAIVRVEGEYIKGSDPILYPIDRADPGCPSEFRFRAVYTNLPNGKRIDLMKVDTDGTLLLDPISDFYTAVVEIVEDYMVELLQDIP